MKICPRCLSKDIYTAEKGTPNDDCFQCGKCGLVLENSRLLKKMPKGKIVFIGVTGGVATVEKVAKGVRVVIVDYDNK